MKIKTAKLIMLILATSMILMTYAIVRGYGGSSPTVWTDKSDYWPGETVSIFGSGFNPNGYFDIAVIRPDGTIVRGDGSFTPGWDTVQTDAYGGFIYYYKLDGIAGLYEVRVYDSPWSGSLSETPLASTTFSDGSPAANLDQARNGPADSPTSPIDWQNGNLGAQQSHYVEGYSVPYRCVLTDMPTGQTVILRLAYKVKDSDNNAIDYLTHYNRINDPLHQDVYGHSPETINPLQTGTGTSLTAADAALISGTTTTFLIPTPPTLNTPVPGQPTGSYNDVIANEGIAAEYMTLYGGTLDNISYETAADLSLTNVYQFIDVTFHLDGTTAVLAWGGHIASRVDWGFFPDGTPRSAGGIHGSPYHMAIEGWTSPDPDTAKALGNLGAQDRSLSAEAVIAPPVPFIALTKTPSATKVENGTLVTYTYNVTNTGGVDFTNMNITDDVFGIITSGQTLLVNQSKIYTHNATLYETTTNTATAFGTTSTGATANATATATVTVIHPAISLTKTPSATKVENGTLVTYTYNVTNTGDTSLTVSLVDDTFGTIFTGKVLAPGAFNVTSITRTLTTTTTNTATAAGVDQLSTNVTAQASATVTVLHPDISLTKKASSTKVENGSLVTYTYNVTNTGDTSLTVSLVDDVFGTLFTGKVLPAGAFNVTVITRTLTTTTTNIATATGVDQLSISVQAQATATVTVLHPAISLTKTPSSTKVENGTSVTYTYNVTNTGDTSLTVSLVDDVFGTIFTGKVLAPGTFNVTTITRTLTTTTTNTATATGVDQLSTSVTAQASATVTVLHPDISLTKTPSATKVENGASVTYTYNVTNTGDTPLTVSLVDDVFGTIFTGKVLVAGAFNVTAITTTLTTTTTNTATATGVDQLSANVTAQASATVTVLHPSISLTKKASSSKVENGSLVTYTYNVTNTGDTSLTVSLIDDTFGTIFTGKVLASGEFNVTSITETLTTTTTNTATATGVDQLSTSVQATDSATVTVIHPNISLTKIPSSSKVENGALVTYTYNVTNTGDTSLTVDLVDDVFGTIFTGKVLAAGAFNVTVINRTLTTTTTNTATATGVDQLDTEVTAEDSATVTVLHPSISLTKKANSSKVENGTTVTYTYNVTNTGDTSLTVDLVDDTFGTIFTGKVLAPGAFNLTVISETLTTTTTNTAEATGTDQLNTEVTAEDSQTVTVLHPDIDLTKTPSSNKVENGSIVTYLYNVTNTGDVALSGNVTDDVFGPIGNFTGLLPGNWVAFTISQALTANTTNTATVHGFDQLGTEVTAEDSATVTVLHPQIHLTKTPSSTKVENGTTVTFLYNVTNIGDVALSGVVFDDVFGAIGNFSGLMPGDWVSFSISRILTANTTNTGTVDAVDQLGAHVQDEDSATVTVLHPSISLTKTPSASKILNGSTVTYTYNITNTGDVSLSGNITDDLIGAIGTYTLLPGDSISFNRTVTLTTTTTNTANATALDQLGTKVSATTSSTVTVIHPSISVEKSCSPEDQLAPGAITWTINVTNTGDVTLTAVNITDTRHGFIDAVAAMIPGQTNTYTIIETNLPPGTYYDNATAFGAHQLGTVSDWDDATCIVRPVYVLKQFTSVTVLPVGVSEGFNATLVDPTHVNVTGLHSGPKIYFTVTYYFENTLNFLGSDFDGQAHNFTLWDKWGGNLMALGSPPVAFDQKTNVVTLADNSTFKIDPSLAGKGSYRYYIGSGLNISNLASQGQAWITMHLGDQQNATNPGNGKGTNKDGSSYDTDIVWYIGQVGVNQSVTLTVYIAPGKNPGGKLQFSSPGCYVINTGPRVRAYGDTYNNDDFLYAVERTNTLTVCVKPFNSVSSLTTGLSTSIFLGALFPVSHTAIKKGRKFRCSSRKHD